VLDKVKIEDKKAAVARCYAELVDQLAPGSDKRLVHEALLEVLAACAGQTVAIRKLEEAVRKQLERMKARPELCKQKVRVHWNQAGGIFHGSYMMYGMERDPNSDLNVVVCPHAKEVMELALQRLGGKLENDAEEAKQQRALADELNPLRDPSKIKAKKKPAVKKEKRKRRPDSDDEEGADEPDAKVPKGPPKNKM
jgi:hypothetical protein